MERKGNLDNILLREELGLHGAINTPVYLSSIFGFPSVEEAAGAFSGENNSFVYSRVNNPTTDVFEKKMAELEEGKKGFAFASGMAAIFAVILTTCKPGDKILCVSEVYGGTHQLLKTVVKNLGIEVITFAPDFSYFPGVDDNVKLVFTETPTNPSLHTVDLDHLKKMVGYNFKNAYICIDNTFATPMFQLPISQIGADFVLHSVTKYISGHSDLVGGVVVCSDTELIKEMSNIRTTTGGIMSPFTAYLCIRGLKTFAVRMHRHHVNSQALVDVFLENLKHVKDVKYPGFGGMLSVEFKSRELARKFAENLEGPTIAVSLGGTETLINVPALMTHSTYSDEALKAIGLSPGLVRISTGIEHPVELANEFKTALDKL